MKQTLEEAAKQGAEGYNIVGQTIYKSGFRDGAEWHAKQSPWIRVEERLPDEGQRVLVRFLYYYKYADREAESRSHTDIFTYENGVWTTDDDISYLGRNVQKDDIKVICWMPIPKFDE